MPRKLISEKSDERNGERKISDPDELNFNGESSDGATTHPEGDDKKSDECLDFIIYLRVYSCSISDFVNRLLKTCRIQAKLRSRRWKTNGQMSEYVFNINVFNI